jgi:hypothetical protein
MMALTPFQTVFFDQRKMPRATAPNLGFFGNTVQDGILEIACWSDPAREVHVQEQEARIARQRS